MKVLPEYKIKMIEWFSEHWYLVETAAGTNTFIPSVTTKLGASPKPFLAHWRGDIGNREADIRMYEASDRGTRLHNAWYVLNGGGVVLFNHPVHETYTHQEIAAMREASDIAILRNQDEMYQIYKLQRWMQAVRPRVIEREKVVASLITNDAGTMDNLLYINAGEYMINGAQPLVLPEGHYVFDLKTGNHVDEHDAPAQVACYAELYKGMYGIECIGSLIVHTGAKTRKGIEGLATIYRDKEEMKKDYEYYRLVASVWDRKLGIEKPKYFELPSLIRL